MIWGDLQSIKVKLLSTCQSGILRLNYSEVGTKLCIISGPLWRCIEGSSYPRANGPNLNGVSALLHSWFQFFTNLSNPQTQTV